jgi:hypothetical protein
MGVALDLATGYLECLMLILAVDAVRRGRRLYILAVVGLAMVFYGRMAHGIISSGLDLAVTAAGLVLAGLTVLADILFEVVEEPEAGVTPPV